MLRNANNNEQNCTIPKDASGSQFVSCLNTVRFNRYNLAFVSRVGKDADNVEVPESDDQSTVVNYTYQIKIDSIRSQNTTQNIEVAPADESFFSVTGVQISPHSPALTGSFDIEIEWDNGTWVSLPDSNGNPISFSGTVNGNTLQSAFRRLPDFEFTSVARYWTTKHTYRWVI